MKKVTVLLAVLVLLSANFTNAQENLPNVNTAIELIPDRVTFGVGGVTLYQLQSKDGNLFVTMNETVYDFYKIATSMGLTARASGVFLKSELAQLILPDQYRQTFSSERAKELEKIVKLQSPGDQENRYGLLLDGMFAKLEVEKEKKQIKRLEKRIVDYEQMLDRAEERRLDKLAKAEREHENNEDDRIMKSMDFMDQLDAMEELDAHYLLSGFGLVDKRNLPIVLLELKKLQISKKAKKEAISKSIEEVIPLAKGIFIDEDLDKSKDKSTSKEASSQSNKDKKDSSEKKSVFQDFLDGKK